MTFLILGTLLEDNVDEREPIYPVDISFDEYDLTPDQEIHLEKTENFYGR